MLTGKTREGDSDMTLKVRMIALAAAILPLACEAMSSPPATSAQALRLGAAVKRLDGGKLESLPTGSLYFRVIHFVQPVGYIVNSTQHVPGFIFVESGLHRLLLKGQQPIEVASGEAKFIQSVTHSHLNPGTDPCSWYFIALWQSSARSQPLVDPIASIVFESADLAPGLRQGAYSQVLRQVTLQRYGHSEAHEFGGMAVLFVLQGSLSVRSMQGGAVDIVAGHGAAFPPNVAIQEVNVATGESAYLELLTTAAGKEFEIPLHQPPGG